MTKDQKDLLFFGYGLGLISVVFGIGGWMRHGFHWQTSVLLVCGAIFAGVTAFHWQALRPGYAGWMMVARLIGGVVTALILTVVYYLIFTPVALVIRLSGRDHLDRKIDPGARSYWIARMPRKELLKEHYLKQY